MSHVQRRRLLSRARRDAFSLPELLVGLAVLGLLAGLTIQAGGESQARQRLEVAARRVALGIERGRAAAERSGRPCALSLTAAGWEDPASGGVPCERAAIALGEGVENGTVTVTHNLPAALRFSSNGLVLDGGTVVVSGAGTPLKRCLVMALPLGVVRLGRYGGPAGGPPSSEACQPDPAL